METRRVEGSAGARGRLFKWERDGGGGEDERDVWVDRYVKSRFFSNGMILIEARVGLVVGERTELVGVGLEGVV